MESRRRCCIEADGVVHDGVHAARDHMAVVMDLAGIGPHDGPAPPRLEGGLAEDHPAEVTTSSFPWSNVLVSSGVARFFTSMAAIGYEPSWTS
jgi:hypothetical protein